MAHVFATFSTWVTPTVHIEVGEAWDANDPVVLAHPDWFQAKPPVIKTSATGNYTAANVDADTLVETATAEPGEKRSVRRRG